MAHTLFSARLAERLLPLRPRWVGSLTFASLVILGAAAGAAPVALAPQYAGNYATGNGANASFVQIDGDWRGSSVRWDEAKGIYGSGAAIGSFEWGTGLWGRADWETVQQTLNQHKGGARDKDAPRIRESWTGTVHTINHANALYNSTYAEQWGAASLVPFFDEKEKSRKQENWTAHFTGFIRVAEAGLYDFSVLNDDGFFLSIVGADGARVEAGRDFLNARDRNGFGEGLELDVGLYGFDLGQWNRLETGVVDLRWRMGKSDHWALVPTAHLLTEARAAQAVPEPGSGWLAGVALAALLLRRRGRGWQNQHTGRHSV